MSTKVLLVDDEAPVLESLQRILHIRRKGWELTCVESADKAWNLLQQAEYDAVVTDICLPGMSGLELLERVQGDLQTRRTPVVIFTGLTNPHLKRQALELGACGSSASRWTPANWWPGWKTSWPSGPSATDWKPWCSFRKS